MVNLFVYKGISCNYHNIKQNLVTKNELNYGCPRLSSGGGGINDQANTLQLVLLATVLLINVLYSQPISLSQFCWHGIKKYPLCVAI